MKINAETIAQIVDGEIEGNPMTEISGPCGIETAESYHISFLGNAKYEPYLYTTRAGIVLVSKDFVPKNPISTTLIKVNNVYAAVATLLNTFNQNIPVNKSYIHPSAIIDEMASIGKDVYIGPGCVVEQGAVVGDQSHLGPMVWVGKNSHVGEGTSLHAGVKIYHDCHIGRNCVIQANTVIGSDGFGYVRDKEGVFSKVPQIGKVIIEDQVEIGANCSIDRATMGETRIGRGAKLDNLIHIAHNVKIGPHTALAAQVGVAGSTEIGAKCLVGGQVGFAGHLKIADANEFQAQSGVATSISEEGGKWFGYPAIEYMKFARAYAVFKKLPDIVKVIQKLEKRFLQ